MQSLDIYMNKINYVDRTMTDNCRNQRLLLLANFYYFEIFQKHKVGKITAIRLWIESGNEQQCPSQKVAQEAVRTHQDINSRRSFTICSRSCPPTETRWKACVGELATSVSGWSPWQHAKSRTSASARSNWTAQWSRRPRRLGTTGKRGKQWSSLRFMVYFFQNFSEIFHKMKDPSSPSPS